MNADNGNAPTTFTWLFERGVSLECDRVMENERVEMKLDQDLGDVAVSTSSL